MQQFKSKQINELTSAFFGGSISEKLEINSKSPLVNTRIVPAGTGFAKPPFKAAKIKCDDTSCPDPSCGEPSSKKPVSVVKEVKALAKEKAEAIVEADVAKTKKELRKLENERAISQHQQELARLRARDEAQAEEVIRLKQVALEAGTGVKNARWYFDLVLELLAAKDLEALSEFVEQHEGSDRVTRKTKIACECTICGKQKKPALTDVYIANKVSCACKPDLVRRLEKSVEIRVRMAEEEMYVPFDWIYDGNEHTRNPYFCGKCETDYTIAYQVLKNDHKCGNCYTKDHPTTEKIRDAFEKVGRELPPGWEYSGRSNEPIIYFCPDCEEWCYQVWYSFKSGHGCYNCHKKSSIGMFRNEREILDIVARRFKSLTKSKVRTTDLHPFISEALGSDQVIKITSYYNNKPEGFEPDHINPCTLFRNLPIEEFALCFSLENLRYLPAVQNGSRQDHLTICEIKETHTSRELRKMYNMGNNAKKKKDLGLPLLLPLTDEGFRLWCEETVVPASHLKRYNSWKMK